MSRNIAYLNQNIELITGNDHVLGKFIQLFDNNLINETPEGEGLVFDYSESFGIEINTTGISNSYPLKTIINTYINDNLNESFIFNPLDINYNFN
jgi:hypothetical protein